MKVLAICTGNTCRSPMIMALVKQLHPNLLVDSAGIYACGEEISENSVKALKEEGIDMVESFVPLTGMDEENIFLSLYARKASTKDPKLITKVNRINYDDIIDDIYSYFQESETDDLATALEELGDDYSEDEIRLVRIKFISEMAN